MLQLIPADITKDTKKIADWFHQQGFESRRKEDFVKAVEYYTMALLFNARHFKAIFNRGISLQTMQGFAFDKLRLYNDAINDYTKALEIDNKNAFAYYNVINFGLSLERDFFR